MMKVTNCFFFSKLIKHSNTKILSQFISLINLLFWGFFNFKLKFQNQIFIKSACNLIKSSNLEQFYSKKGPLKLPLFSQ